MEHSLKFPRLGQRIVRSVLAALLCMLVYYLRGMNGIPFFAVIAALQCIQPYMKNMRNAGRNRIIGTLVGAAWGSLVLYIEFWALGKQGYGYSEGYSEMLHFVLVALCVGAVIYSAVTLGVSESAYFSCVVFLSIAMNHVTDENPAQFIIDRILDTTIGVAVGIFVNSLHFPRLKHPEILFVSGIGEMMSDSGQEPPAAGKAAAGQKGSGQKAAGQKASGQKASGQKASGEPGQLTSFTKITLNRMIEDGAKFTVMTMQTPAMIRESIPGVLLKHPVIAMDGAVMYDMNSRRYLYAELMDEQTGAEVDAFFRQEKAHYFINTIEDHLLVIFYHEMAPGAMERLYQQRRVSPYRNYVKTDRDVHTNVVYYLTTGPREEVEAFRKKLLQQPFADRIRAVVDTYKCAEGDVILRVYSAEATRERMLQRLKEHVQAEKIVNFGPDEPGADVCLSCCGDAMVKEMKHRYEPISLAGWRNMLKV